jgi:hypothetical protein
MWRDVQYAPYYFDRTALDKTREGKLILQPAVPYFLPFPFKGNKGN